MYSTTNKLYVQYNKRKKYVQYNNQTVCNIQQAHTV